MRNFKSPPAVRLQTQFARCDNRLNLVRNVGEKGKGLPQQAEVAQGVSCRLRFLTFGTTRVVGRQPYASAAFTPVKIPGTHFQRLSRPQGTVATEKIPSDTTGNRSRDRPTSSTVP